MDIIHPLKQEKLLKMWLRNQPKKLDHYKSHCVGRRGQFYTVALGIIGLVDVAFLRCMGIKGWSPL